MHKNLRRTKRWRRLFCWGTGRWNCECVLIWLFLLRRTVPFKTNRVASRKRLNNFGGCSVFHWKYNCLWIRMCSDLTVPFETNCSTQDEPSDIKKKLYNFGGCSVFHWKYNCRWIRWRIIGQDWAVSRIRVHYRVFSITIPYIYVPRNCFRPDSSKQCAARPLPTVDQMKKKNTLLFIYN